jgi:LPXTG-site transpeptidase (sortase) family protein
VRTQVAVGVLLLAPLLSACSAGATKQPATPPPGTTASVARAPAPVPAATNAQALVPRRLQIPAIGVDTTLERLRTAAGGELQAPRRPMRAGWFPGGAVPGELGAAVIAGHRDSRSGPAVFWRLVDVHDGDRVSVTRSDGTVARFTVVDVRRVARRHFPTAAVYGPTPDETLRLITCGGVYDHVHGRYLDNVLVLAVAA